MRISGYLISLIVFSLSSSGFTAEVKPKYGPANHPYATPLAEAHDYFQSSKHPAPDFWALIGFYVPQYSGPACGTASITMVLNAARVHVSKTSDDKVIMQPELVEKTPGHGWKERMSTAGLGIKLIHGMHLGVLHELAEAAFKGNGFPNVQIEEVHVNDVSSKTLAQVHQALVENEKNPGDFMIASFDQKYFTDDSEAGHIAPVGAYDADKKRVLIMDPDREYYEPYWVSEQRFVEAMYTHDSESGKFRGFVVIKPGH